LGARISEIINTLHDTRATDLAGVAAQIGWLEYHWENGASWDYGEVIYRNIAATVLALAGAAQP
jgi:hypothetical protein